MNNYYVQNKKEVLKELESLLSEKKVLSRTEENEMFVYCNLMKKYYLSFSTNN